MLGTMALMLRGLAAARDEAHLTAAGLRYSGNRRAVRSRALLNILACISEDHQPMIVALAALTALGGASAFFFVMAHANECVDKRRSTWLLVAALVGGLSIWAVHFVAMLGYASSVNLSFDPAITLVSALLVAIGFLLAVSAKDGRTGGASLLAGCIAALSVTLMHFVGMAAIQRSVTVRYDSLPIAIAIIS